MESGLYILSSVAISFLAVYVWRQRHVHGARPFALAALGVACWSSTRMLGSITANDNAELLRHHFEVAFAVGTSVVWLIFIIQYTGNGRWLTYRNLILLSIFPLMTLVPVLASSLSGPVWGQQTTGFGQVVVPSLSPTEFGHWAYSAFNILVAVTTVLMLLGMWVNARKYYRAQVLTLLIALIGPATWYSLYQFKTTSLSLPDLTPFFLTLSAGVTFIGIFRYRLLDLVPLSYQGFAHDVTDAIIVTDVYHRVVDLNPASERIFNQSVAHVIGQPFASLFSAWPESPCPCHEGEDKGNGRRMVNSVSGHYCEDHVSTLTGRDGNRIGHLHVLFDITERRVKEDALRERAARSDYLSALIENAGSAIITFDMDGRIRTWNRAAEAIYGWKHEEVAGQLLPMVPEPSRTEIRNHIAEIRATCGAVNNLETLWRRKDRVMVPVLATLSCVPDASGNACSIICTSLDVSRHCQVDQDALNHQRAVVILEERKRMARELHDGVGQVLSYVSMQAYTVHQLLSRGRNADANNLINRIMEVAQNAQADMRNMIHGMNVGMPLDTKTPGLVPALRSYLDTLARGSHVLVELTADPELLKVPLAADTEVQVIRIVQEAVTNVGKHAAAEHIRISLTLDGNNLHGIVEDDGCGFAPEAIFDSGVWRFGMRMMAERAEEVGGHVQMQSSPGHGTKVILDVPFNGRHQSPAGSMASIKENLGAQQLH